MIINQCHHFSLIKSWTLKSNTRHLIKHWLVHRKHTCTIHFKHQPALKWSKLQNIRTEHTTTIQTSKHGNINVVLGRLINLFFITGKNSKTEKQAEPKYSDTAKQDKTKQILFSLKSQVPIRESNLRTCTAKSPKQCHASCRSSRN